MLSRRRCRREWFTAEAAEKRISIILNGGLPVYSRLCEKGTRRWGKGKRRLGRTESEELRKDFVSVNLV